MYWFQFFFLSARGLKIDLGTNFSICFCPCLPKDEHGIVAAIQTVNTVLLLPSKCEHTELSVKRGILNKALVVCHESFFSHHFLKIPKIIMKWECIRLWNQRTWFEVADITQPVRCFPCIMTATLTFETRWNYTFLMSGFVCWSVAK